jgi:hypothetical protein
LEYKLLNKFVKIKRSRQATNALLIGALMSILVGFATVSTLTAQDLNPLGAATENIELASNVFQDDSEVTVARLGFLKSAAAVSAAGDSSPGPDSTASEATAINNAITEGNWTYRFTIVESSDGDWGTSREYKVEVYQAIGSDTTLNSTLYFKNSTDGSGPEGVTATIDLASATILPDSFSIIVSRVAD